MKTSERSNLIQEKRIALTHNLEMLMKEIVDVDACLTLFQFLGMLSRFQDDISDLLQQAKNVSQPFFEDILKQLNFAGMNDLLLELIQSLHEDEDTSTGLWYEFYSNLGACYILHLQQEIDVLVEDAIAHMKANPNTWEHISDFAEDLEELYPIADDDLTRKFVMVTICTSVLKPQSQISSDWEKALETFQSLPSIPKENSEVVIPLKQVASSALTQSQNIQIQDLIDEKCIYADIVCTITYFKVKNKPIKLLFDTDYPIDRIKVFCDDKEISLQKNDDLFECPFSYGHWRFIFGKKEIQRKIVME